MSDKQTPAVVAAPAVITPAVAAMMRQLGVDIPEGVTPAPIVDGKGTKGELDVFSVATGLTPAKIAKGINVEDADAAYQKLLAFVATANRVAAGIANAARDNKRVKGANGHTPAASVIGLAKQVADRKAGRIDWGRN